MYKYETDIARFWTALRSNNLIAEYCACEDYSFNYLLTYGQILLGIMSIAMGNSQN